MTSYREYVADGEFMRGYAEYQKRYAQQVRESDKVLIALVRELAEGRGRPLRLLDAGCSTGNLLLHLKHAVPGLELVGGDLAADVLEECRRDPDLAGIGFEELDLLDLGFESGFDVVVANAVLYLLTEPELERAAASVSRALRPGGAFLAFDFFHPFEQELEILERSQTHPDGLALHFRPYGGAQAVLRAAGFERVEFRPFEIPIDLPRPERDDEIVSYTRRTHAGERLLFRGTLFQPWCHLVAQKAA